MAATDHPATVSDLLSRRALAYQDRIALAVDGGDRLSYQQWEARSNATARGLHERGIRAGDRVGLLFNNTEWIDFAVSYMGALKVGAVAVPLSNRMTESEVCWALNSSGARLVMHTAQVPTELPASVSRAPVDEVEDGWPTEPVRSPATPDSLAEILYTSGTTGRPKGVTCSHRHIVRPIVEASHTLETRLPIVPNGTFVHANSLSTAAGQLRLLEPLGSAGMTTVALPAFDAERYCEVIHERQVDVVQMVPAMALTLLDTQTYKAFDLTSVRIVLLGCAPLPPSVLPKLASVFPNSKLINQYELSEARYIGTCAVYGMDPPNSVGRPRERTTIRIVNEDGAELGPEQPGEVCVQWAGLAPQSYYDDPVATAQVFPDGWTRTGDAGFLDGAGNLILVDRLKDIVVSGGESVSTLEVEDVLLKHDAVADVAVVGVAHEIYGEVLAAAVVLSRPADTDELKKYLREELSQHKVPKLIALVDAIPRNAAGKPLKREVREAFKGDTTEAVPDLAAVPAGAEAVRRVIGEILGSIPDPADNLFDIGLDSLQASRIAARLSPLLGKRVPAAAALEHPTFERLISYLDSVPADGTDDRIQPRSRPAASPDG